MKATELFTQTIKSYLDERAKSDELFATAYAKPKKSLDECINYILQEVQKSGCNGFADDEIYGMAVHYYDEDELGQIHGAKGRVVVNHHIELSNEEKQAAREQAIAKYQADIIAEQKAKAAKRPAVREQPKHVQPSLFDLL